MDQLFRFVTRTNVVTFVILLYVVIGCIKVILGDLTLEVLVALLTTPVAALAAGAGLASIKFTPAPAGEQVLAIAVILVLAYAIVGAVQVLASDLTFEAYLHIMAVPLGGLAVGKGLFANNRTG